MLRTPPQQITSLLAQSSKASQCCLSFLCSLHRSIDPVAVDNKQQGPCEQCLYPSFAAIRKSLEKYDHCKTVVYTVALYPPRNQVTGNRTYGHVDESLSSPRHWDVKFPSPASGKEEGLCNLALVTTNTIVPTRHYEGWTMVDIPDDLIPVPGQHSRSAHTLRATPFLLFPAAERIYYADTKCNISTFYEKTRDRNPDAKMVALKHKDFYQKPGNMLREFDEAFMHLKQRHVPLQDLKDILFQLQKYRAEGFLTTEREISLSDNMCLYFQKDTKAMQDFLCTWNCEIMNESMRTQLSFAYAVEKAGLEPGKDVEYVEYYYGDRERSSRKTWSLRLRSRGSGSHGRQ